MNKMEEISSILIEKTDFLRQMGYNNRVEKSDVWNFTLSYLASDKELAIEFEIDYRDLDLFVLVTILENGELPSGYYMHKGKKVRVHLEKLFESGKIKAGDWKGIRRIRRELKEPNVHKIITLINAYCILLKEAINEIQQLKGE
ncbi:hypothetical protein [Ruminiclostridium cellobioparum]|uniref:hypothetical protein n=1 Tax=Ruminiclostridium cellobioparum TaxID=29355 RepID=UPI0004828E70|nr:hypothetical protein [Ruminiclostridium cellobioparum]